MQGRVKFSVYPIAEFYARHLHQLDWPIGPASTRGEHTQLVSPLMSEMDAKRIVENLRRKDADNANAYDYVASRFRMPGSTIRFRVIIKLNDLNCTTKEFYTFKNNLDEKGKLQLLAYFLNHIHAPFNEKYWGIGKEKNNTLRLCYVAPSRNHHIVDEPHQGWAYPDRLFYAYSKAAKAAGFTPEIQQAFKENIKIKDAFRKTCYYFNPDFIPTLLGIIDNTLIDMNPLTLSQSSTDNNEACELDRFDSSNEGKHILKIPGALEPTPGVNTSTEQSAFYDSGDQFPLFRKPARDNKTAKPLDSFDIEEDEFIHSRSSDGCNLM